jgi:hypothetical protein
MSFDVFENIFTASDPAGGRAIKVSALAGIENAESYYTQNDPAGGRAIKVKIIAGGASTGTLQVAGGVALDATLRNITDTSVTPVASTLYMSTETVAIKPNSNFNSNLFLIDSNGYNSVYPTIRVNMGSGNGLASLVRFSYGELASDKFIGDFRADKGNGITFNASWDNRVEPYNTVSYPINFYVREASRIAMKIVGGADATAGNVEMYYSLSVAGDIKFGESTSAYPMLRRNGSYVDFKLADNSNFTGFYAGQSSFVKNSLGAADASIVLSVANNTAAASGAQQNSPAIAITGTGWSGSASVAVGFKISVGVFGSTSYELKFATFSDTPLMRLSTSTLGLRVNTLAAENTADGLKIGADASQKLGFWNTTPIVQPTTAVASATIVTNSGTNVHQSTTFDGYTVAQVVKALRNTGLLQ